MKFDRTLRRNAVPVVAASLAATALAALPCLAPRANAWPSTSPSAKSAARLKYHPPKNWLEHYLPDDRYKIAGGTWKVVSTQYDTYYHEPSSPLMLRQPASIVIGFSSEQEAIDAGYRRGSSMVGYGSGGSVGGGRNARNNKQSPARGIRVTLADGVSTAIVPANWTRIKSQARTVQVFNGTGQIVNDVFLSPNRKNGVKFGFSTAPAAVNLEPFVTASWTKKNASAVSGQIGNITGQGSAPKNVSSVKFTSTSLSGLRGVRWSPVFSGKKPAGAPAYLVAAARRNKIFFVSPMSSNSSAEQNIIRSFKPR